MQKGPATAGPFMSAGEICSALLVNEKIMEKLDTTGIGIGRLFNLCGLVVRFHLMLALGNRKRGRGRRKKNGGQNGNDAHRVPPFEGESYDNKLTWSPTPVGLATIARRG